MISVDIPGSRHLDLAHLVLDYNAALADEIVQRLLADYLPCFRATIGRARTAASA